MIGLRLELRVGQLVVHRFTVASRNERAVLPPVVADLGDHAVHAHLEPVVPEQDPQVDVLHALAGQVAVVPAGVHGIHESAVVHGIHERLVTRGFRNGCPKQSVLVECPVIGTLHDRLHVPLGDDEVAAHLRDHGPVRVLDDLNQVGCVGLVDDLDEAVLDAEWAGVACGIGTQPIHLLLISN